MSERNITLKLTMIEVNNLLNVIDFVEEQRLQTPILLSIRNRLAKSKARAIQRGCSRAPHELAELNQMVAEGKIKS